MSSSSSSTAVPSSSTLVVTRQLAAARSLVYQMWTEPVHLVHWWRPSGFAPPIIEALDVRPGGAFRLRMLHESGHEYTCHSVYRDVDPPARLSYLERCFEDGVLFHEAELSIDLAEHDGGTLVTIRAVLAYLPERDPKWTPDVMQQGWTQGWKDNLDLLVRYLESL